MSNVSIEKRGHINHLNLCGVVLLHCSQYTHANNSNSTFFYAHMWMRNHALPLPLLQIQFLVGQISIVE